MRKLRHDPRKYIKCISIFIIACFMVLTMNNSSLTMLAEENVEDTTTDVVNVDSETTENMGEEAVALREQTIQTISDDGKTIKITGQLPEGATVSAASVDAQSVLSKLQTQLGQQDDVTDNYDVLFGYNIEILDSNGNIYEPSDYDNQVDVKVYGIDETLLQSVETESVVDVYHIDDQDVSEIIDSVNVNEIQEQSITFTADTFSIVAGLVKKMEVAETNSDEEIMPIAATYSGSMWCTNTALSVNGQQSVQLDENKLINVGSAGVNPSVFVESTIKQSGSSYLYWKTMYQTGEDKQTAGSDSNHTGDGTEVRYIRKYNENWQYSADGKTYYNLESSGQLTFYYYQLSSIEGYAQIGLSDWFHTYSDWNKDKCDMTHPRAIYIRIMNEAGKVLETSDTYYYHSGQGVKHILINEYEGTKYTITKAELSASSSYNNQTKDNAWTEENPRNKEGLTIYNNNVDINKLVEPDWSKGNKQILTLYVQERGSLSISKTLASDGGANKDFQFQVTLNSTGSNVVKGSYEYTIDNVDSGTLDFTNVNGQWTSTFNLKAGQTITISGLETSLEYSVEEIGDYSGYIPSYNYSNEEKKITAGNTDTVQVTNTKDEVTNPKRLTITKTFDNVKGLAPIHYLNMINSFEINVKDSERTIVSSFNTRNSDGGLDTYNDIISQKLDSYTLTWTVDTLEAGQVYTVSEENYTVEDVNYIQVDAQVNTNGVAGGSVQNIEIDSSQDNSIAFTNTYDVQEKTVSVTKHWRDESKKEESVLVVLYKKTIGSNEEVAVTTDNGSFIYSTLNESNNWTTSQSDLQPVNSDGSEITYVYREMKQDEKGEVIIDGVRYSPVKESETFTEDGNQYQVSYSGDEDKQIITNTFSNPSSLTIDKNVVGKYGDLTRKFTIYVKLTDRDNNPLSNQTFGKYSTDESGKITLELSSNDEPVTIEGLPTYVKYRVTEESAEGYTTTYQINEEEASKECDSSLSGSNAKVTVINTRADIPTTGINDSNLPLLGVWIVALSGAILYIISLKRRIQ